MSVQDEIDQINYELSRVQKNKATEHYIGNLRARMAKMLAKDTSSKGGGLTYSVKKQGHATIAFVGFPSVGKSTLLNALTDAESKTASYEFTTVRPIPGMLEYNKTKLQLIDAPGIIEGASKGKGMGRQIISSVRNADLILILLDPFKKRLDIIQKELFDAGIRLDVKPTEMILKRTVKGGLNIQSTVKQSLDDETIVSMIREFGYINADVILREDVTIDRLIDGLTGNRVYVKSIIVFNKLDMLNKKEIESIKKEFPQSVFISAEKEIGLDKLKEILWTKLEFKRIYLKRPGHEPYYCDPLITKGRVTIKDVILKIRKDHTSARVWGKSVKHQGQTVGLNHQLADEDVITFG